MNKLLITLAGALTLGAALPVFAGPDWQIIEKARKEKQATQLAQHGDAVQPPAAQNCPPEPLVLSLDHGPRAQSTPYLNRLRTERHEAQVKACAGAAK